MNKPTLRTVFRTLVIASLLLPLIGVAYEFAVTSGLTEDEQVILQWSGHGSILESAFNEELASSSPSASWALVAGLVVLVLGLLVAQIGLFFFRPWARTWWAIATVVFLPASLLLGWSIMLPFTQFCHDLGMVMSGGILALCYASPLAHAFSPAKAQSPEVQ
ncbi:MAG: hypothetical protein ACOYMN_08600 [Roseimicrobium sp.]